MTQEFLPRDPAKALVEVKEKLYERLQEVKTTPPWQIDDEETFLKNLLDIIERS